MNFFGVVVWVLLMNRKFCLIFFIFSVLKLISCNVCVCRLSVLNCWLLSKVCRCCVIRCMVRNWWFGWVRKLFLRLVIWYVVVFWCVGFGLVILCVICCKYKCCMLVVVCWCMVWCVVFFGFWWKMLLKVILCVWFWLFCWWLNCWFCVICCWVLNCVWKFCWMIVCIWNLLFVMVVNSILFLCKCCIVIL